MQNAKNPVRLLTTSYIKLEAELAKNQLEIKINGKNVY